MRRSTCSIPNGKGKAFDEKDRGSINEASSPFKRVCNTTFAFPGRLFKTRNQQNSTVKIEVGFKPTPPVHIIMTAE